ncbi:MAG TPA: AIR synthase-related protein, partial [Woeseiaceae bacterium]
AHGAIDISDGLVGDLRKMLDASGVGAEVEVDRVPLSAALSARFDADASLGFAMTGGDDYELCFTAPAAAADRVAALAAKLQLDLTCIGEIRQGDTVQCMSNGKALEIADTGYLHFRGATP